MNFKKTFFFLFAPLILTCHFSAAGGQPVPDGILKYQPALDANHWGPDWSPDGKKLVFAGRLDEENGYYLLEMDLETGEIKGLAATGTHEVRPRYSPDGAQILYLTEMFGETQDIALYDRRSGETNRVTVPGSEAWVMNRPVWAPDGRTIYFDTIAGETGRDIYRYDLSSGKLTTIIQGPGNESYANISPDGKLLSYRDDFDGDPDLFIHDLETGKTRKLTDNDFVDQAAVWSPDGRWLAYFANPTGDNEIFLIDPKGGDPVRLTYSHDWDFMPAFSPDMSKIAFDSRRTGIRGIYVMDLTGENVEFLSHPENSTLIEEIREKGAFDALKAYEASLGGDAYSEIPFLSPEIANLVQKALDSNSFSEALALADAWLKADSWTMARDTWTQGTLSEVLPHLALRFSLSPTSQNLTLYGIALSKLGRFEEAETAFKEALGKNPDESLATRGLKELEPVLNQDNS